MGFNLKYMKSVIWLLRYEFHRLFGPPRRRETEDRLNRVLQSYLRVSG